MKTVTKHATTEDTEDTEVFGWIPEIEISVSSVSSVVESCGSSAPVVENSSEVSDRV